MGTTRIKKKVNIADIGTKIMNIFQPHTIKIAGKSEINLASECFTKFDPNNDNRKEQH